eukprot:2934565-Prymnesium_polylepis.1
MLNATSYFSCLRSNPNLKLSLKPSWTHIGCASAGAARFFSGGRKQGGIAHLPGCGCNTCGSISGKPLSERSLQSAATPSPTNVRTALPLQPGAHPRTTHNTPRPSPAARRRLHGARQGRGQADRLSETRARLDVVESSAASWVMIRPRPPLPHLWVMAQPRLPNRRPAPCYPRTQSPRDPHARSQGAQDGAARPRRGGGHWRPLVVHAARARALNRARAQPAVGAQQAVPDVGGVARARAPVRTRADPRGPPGRATTIPRGETDVSPSAR